MCVIDKMIFCIERESQRNRIGQKTNPVPFTFTCYAQTNLLWLTAARLLTAPRDKKHAGGMFLPLETAETGSIGSGQRARRPCFKEKGSLVRVQQGEPEKSTCTKQVLFSTKFAAARQEKWLRREMHLRCVKYPLRGC